MTFAQARVDRALTPSTSTACTVPLYTLTWCNGAMYRYSVPMTDDASTQLLEQRLDAACAHHREALRALRDARATRNAAVVAARAGGLTWERIADRFGVTKNTPIFWLKCEGGLGHG